MKKDYEYTSKLSETYGCEFYLKLDFKESKLQERDQKIKVWKMIAVSEEIKPDWKAQFL